MKLIQAQNYEFNRKAIEQKKCNALLFPSLIMGKDKPKQLDSGLDEITARIASKNKIAIALNLQTIQNMIKEEKAIALAKFKQNIKICKKTKTSILILNSHDKKEAFSLLLTLGASTEQAKKAISF